MVASFAVRVTGAPTVLGTVVLKALTALTTVPLAITWTPDWSARFIGMSVVLGLMPVA
jgi:hypothetical protein